jgi:enamine deaminase RidA (YjgF/YER057c/UK114 family)
MNLKAQLDQLGLSLPPVAKPAANYDPAVETDRFLLISGQLPRLDDGSLLATGKLGAGVDLDTGIACARQCGLNALAVLNGAIGGGFRLKFRRVLRVGVYVASSSDFTDQHLVADGASELLQQVFGGKGRHARAAVGCVSLPKDAPVEVELWVELMDERFEGD